MTPTLNPMPTMPALQTRATVALWGNTPALRLPFEMAQMLNFRTNDEVVLQVREHTLTVAKPQEPQEGTIEYLFKDYSGKKFNTKLKNPLSAAGKEKW
jgi:antitoxin component of MazEF toxin-antitoxin module